MNDFITGYLIGAASTAFVLFLIPHVATYWYLRKHDKKEKRDE